MLCVCKQSDVYQRRTTEKECRVTCITTLPPTHCVVDTQLLLHAGRPLLLQARHSPIAVPAQAQGHCWYLQPQLYLQLSFTMPPPHTPPQDLALHQTQHLTVSGVPPGPVNNYACVGCRGLFIITSGGGCIVSIGVRDHSIFVFTPTIQPLKRLSVADIHWVLFPWGTEATAL